MFKGTKGDHFNDIMELVILIADLLLFLIFIYFGFTGQFEMMVFSGLMLVMNRLENLRKD